MPVFNGEKFLEEAIDSLLNQSFADFELIICDNASTDGTEKICRSYVDADDRVKYLRNRSNYGLVHNFNNVFRLSSGRYFKWAASDDVCATDFLLKTVGALERDPSLVLAYSRTVGIDPMGSPVPLRRQPLDANSPLSTYSADPVIRFRRVMRDPWWVAGPFFGLIRSEVLERTALHGNFSGGDHVLMAELALRGRFYEVPEDLFFLRMHPGKASAISSLKDRIAFYDGHPDEQEGPRMWRLIRGYPRRLRGYRSAIARSSIGTREAALCHAEIGRSVLWWLNVRGIPALSRLFARRYSQVSA